MAFLKAFLFPLLLILIIADFVFFRFLLRVLGSGSPAIYGLILFIFIEYYVYQAIRTVTNSHVISILYVAITVLLYIALIYFSATNKAGMSSTAFKNIVIAFTLFVAPKIFIALLMILEDFYRMIAYTFQSFGSNAVEVMPSRRKAIAWIAIGLAAIPFFGSLYGIFIGKYRFRVIRQKVYFEDLPDEFNGFTITQLSDIHSGSFDDIEKVKYGIEMAAAQNSDILVFTGDIVNNVYTELVPYVELFSKLKAKQGMFATLGNHDYGDYGDLTQEEKRDSIQRIQAMQRQMGFEPLNNEMRTITKNGKRLNIVGVENFGSSPYFPKKGDLSKATQGVKEGDFNVLLSHDPSHFDHDLDGYDNVVDFPKKMHLTLSGHTHGMQFGIEIPGLIKWSPVKYRYHNWAGLYEQKGKKLYVNRGFGYLAFPGRIGIWPEITVLELTNKKST